MTDQDRQEFEAKFSRPPYEFGMERFGDNSAWPGNYRDYHTQCAWEGYRAARTPSQAPAPGDAGVVEALRPMTDAQADELWGEANRGFCIERDDYLKAVRDTEAFHRAALSAGDAAPQPSTEESSVVAPQPVGEEAGWIVDAYAMPAKSQYTVDEIKVQRMRQRDGANLWKVSDGRGSVLGKGGEWEYEPMPSSRDDEFLARCRFASAEEAMAAACAAQPATQKEMP